MSSSEKRKADSSATRAGEEDNLSTSKKSKAAVDNRSGSITDAVSHLHNLLQTKEEELDKREIEFERRVKTFESSLPSIGGDNDVIQLNVGGQTNIAVLRNTLTQFPDSMLAAKFSGRWDDSFEKDEHGRFFVDEDPENFRQLLTFLRMRMKGPVPSRHIPNPTYKFCSMLEYYNLMPGVYGQGWVGGTSAFTCEEVGYGAVSLTSDDFVGLVRPHRILATKPALKLVEFTVEFEKGTNGCVGWLHTKDKLAETKIVSGVDFKHSFPNSLYLNLGERKAFGPSCTDNNVLAKNLRINHTESTTKLVCRRSGGHNVKSRRFSVQLEDGTEVDAMLDYENSSKTVMPMIVFSGKVTVSDLNYAIDELLI